MASCAASPRAPPATSQLLLVLCPRLQSAVPTLAPNQPLREEIKSNFLGTWHLILITKIENSKGSSHLFLSPRYQRNNSIASSGLSSFDTGDSLVKATVMIRLASKSSKSSKPSKSSSSYCQNLLSKGQDKHNSHNPLSVKIIRVIKVIILSRSP